MCILILIRDDVIGHANQRFDFHRDSQLFAEFANDSIFQPFHKLHTPAGEAPGACLGLLLSQRQENLSILQNHTADADPGIAWHWRQPSIGLSKQSSYPSGSLIQAHNSLL